MALIADQKKIHELEKKLKDVEMEREILTPCPFFCGKVSIDPLFATGGYKRKMA